MTTATIAIAQEYEQSGNLGTARAELEKLDVANPTQFLIFLAEGRVDSDPGSAETAALVHMALAMGLQSGQLMAYATQYGLLANSVAPTATPAPMTLPVAQSIAPTTSAEQPAATVIAAQPVESAQETTGTGASTTDAPAVDANQAPPAANPLPTATTEPPTATPISKPMIQASNGLNVRSGPGTAYPVVGALNSGQQADIVAKNPEGDWWQVSLPTGGAGWVYGPLVQAMGDTASITVASDIPAAPPTPTPAPVAEVPAEQPPAEQPPAEQPPAEQPPAEEPPAEQAPPPVAAGPDFAGVERRLWTVEETGGAVDSGGSVRCGEKRELHVIVLDANGNRLNGVAVQAIYGAQEIFVTGAQGKGDGQVEFVLGAGQGVKVIRDADGREVTSDSVEGLSTHSPEISHSDLIGAHYCTDDASCDKFNFSAGCWGHHSWTVTFKRKY
ncbi:MAG: SH3 domain-containing protein [Caldilineaceae bacterium]|nr:SH3 domain-containing protein [Caldilineaceae bacterium]